MLCYKDPHIQMWFSTDSAKNVDFYVDINYDIN